MVKTEIRLWLKQRPLFLTTLFKEKSKEKVLFSQENSAFLVGVPGFE